MFGFEDFEYKTFKNNFLKTVIFNIKFQNIENFEGLIVDIESIFKEKFPRQKKQSPDGVQLTFTSDSTPIVTNTSGNENLFLEMRSENGQMILAIHKTELTLTISGKEYENSNSLMSCFDIISKFLTFCEVTEVIRLSVRKINIIEFIKGDDSSVILKELINNELIGNIQSFPSSDKILHSLQSLRFKNESDLLHINYGLASPQAIGEDRGQIVIDIDLIHFINEDVGNITSLTERINREIYNIFNWVISDNTRQLLDE